MNCYLTCDGGNANGNQTATLFYRGADTLNFSRAAESVYLSQSALSRQIMDLEKEVGLPLLRRSTRQV